MMHTIRFAPETKHACLLRHAEDGLQMTLTLDLRSFLNNDEVNAVVLGDDFADQMEAMFQDDLSQSSEIALEQWKCRGLSSRVKEIAARVWARWL